MQGAGRSVGAAGLTTIARYLYGRLLLATLAAMTALATMELLYKTHDLYRFVVAGLISATELAVVCAAFLPVVFYHAAPEMVTIAVLARYYLWRQHNEILTLRGAGLSCWQIARPGLAVGVCAALFTASMAMYALPRSIGVAENIRAAAELRIAPPMLQEGISNELAPGLSISFQRWRTSDVIDGVVLTDDREPGRFSFVNAARAQFIEAGGSYVMVIQKGMRFTQTATGVDRVSFEEFSIPLGGETPSTARKANGYYEQSIAFLLSPPEEVRQNPQLWTICVMEGHHRIINPLRCIGCVLLVLGILVPGRQGYTELFIRLVLALGAAFAENSASTVIFAMTQRTMEAAPLLYILPLLSAGIGALLLCAGDSHFGRWARWVTFRPADPAFASDVPEAVALE